MQATLRIVDQTPTGKVTGEVELILVRERVTVRELIERRVRQEVEQFNDARGGIFSGLVQPSDTEAELNGYRLRNPRLLDADAQCAQALEGFESNGFFMLVDDRQVESLDEEIVIGPNTSVSFIKLVQLVGG